MAEANIIDIQAKSILSKLSRPGEWFHVTYNVNLYRGCQHGCVYCDSRSECYRIDDFDSSLLVKNNALELFQKEISGKKEKAVIGTGAMSDPYTPVEEKRKMTRQLLEIVAEREWPLHMATKSDMILRDVDILQKISKTYLTVGITVTTCSDELARIIEPHAPLPSDRIKALRELRSAGIYAGILLMPVLPYIEDNRENIYNIVRAAHSSGASFIIPGFGVTLRDRQREYYYRFLQENYPEKLELYRQTYRDKYSCSCVNGKDLHLFFSRLCMKAGITCRQKDIIPYIEKKKEVQLSFLDIENK